MSPISKLDKKNLIARTAASYRGFLILNLFLSCGLAVATAVFAAIIGPLLQLFMNQGLDSSSSIIQFSTLLGPVLSHFINSIWGIDGLPRHSVLEALPILLVIAGAARFTFFVSQWYLIENIGERLAGKIRKEIVTAYLSVDLNLSKTDAGYNSYEDRLYTSITHDIRMIREYFVRFYGGLPREVIQVSVLTLSLFIISYQMTLIFLLGILPFVVLISRYGKKIRRRSDKILKEFASLSEWVQQRFLGIETIKHYHSENLEQERLGKFLGTLLHAQEKAANAKAKSSAISEFAAIAAIAIVFSIALQKTHSEQLSGAIILNFFTTIAFISQSASKFSKYYNINREAAAAVSRTLSLHSYFSGHKKPELWDPASFSLESQTQNILAVKDVYLSYGESQEFKVLTQISTSFEVGKFYAIFGKTGAGKSTFLKVLSGELTPDSGTVVYPKALLGSELKFIWVPQRITPVRDLVWQNVVYPHDSYDSEKLWYALEQAQAKDTVEKLSHREKTSLLTGRSLSGGEIQRLFIARMFYHKHKLNIIDEGTSALDQQSELAILSNMRDFVREGHCVIMVAHRQVVKEYADDVLYLNGGRIENQ